MILRGELDELAGRRGVELHYVIGDHRTASSSAPSTCGSSMPDIAARDVYVCGPPAMTEATRASLDRSGVLAPPHLHRAVRALMRRAIVALLVTAVAVVLLARYETHPPRDAQPERGARRPLARDRARAVPGAADRRPGPAMTTPFSVIQVQAHAHATGA